MHTFYRGTKIGKGGTSIGCQNWSCQTDFGSKSGPGGPILAKFFAKISLARPILLRGDRFWHDRTSSNLAYTLHFLTINVIRVYILFFTTKTYSYPIWNVFTKIQSHIAIWQYCITPNFDQGNFWRMLTSNIGRKMFWRMVTIFHHAPVNPVMIFKNWRSSWEASKTSKFPPSKLCAIATVYCNTFKYNTLYDTDPYCFTPIGHYILVCQWQSETCFTLQHCSVCCLSSKLIADHHY